MVIEKSIIWSNFILFIPVNIVSPLYKSLILRKGFEPLFSDSKSDVLPITLPEINMAVLVGLEPTYYTLTVYSIANYGTAHYSKLLFNTLFSLISLIGWFTIKW